MMEHMAGVWIPVRGVTIRSELCQRRFLFQFFHHLDLQKVLKGGPWFFNKHMLILGAVEEGEGPEQMPLNTIPFWVQVPPITSKLYIEDGGKKHRRLCRRAVGI
jgi:hypothetical protein